MWKAALRSLLERKLRLVLMMLAIVLGVGMVSGTYVLSDSIQRAFNDLFSRRSAGFDLLVRARPQFENAPRAKLPEALRGEIESVEGVSAVTGSVQDFVQIVDESGRAAGGPGPPTFISSFEPEGAGRQAFEENTRMISGRPASAGGEAMLDRYAAERRGWTLGTKVRLATRLWEGVRELKIVGTFEVRGISNLGGATVFVMRLDAAQQLLDRGDTLDTISVRGEEGASAATLQKRVDAHLPEEYEVISQSDSAREALNQVRQGIGFLTNALLTFGFVALFVGAFMIFNTFSILFAQRMREFAMLRAIGARGRQVLGVVLAEAAIIGAVASAFGIALGFATALGLQAVMRAFGIRLPTSGTPLLPRTIIVSMAVGVAVTLVAAAYPAVRASRVAPLAAVRESALPARRRASRRRNVLALVLTAGAVALLVWGLFGEPPNTLAVLGAGAALLFLGVAIGSPTFARPVARAIGWPFSRSFGVPGQIARGNAMRDPNRTAATAAALMIGVALVSFMAIMASSIKATTDEALRERLRADYFLFSQAFGGGPVVAGFSPFLYERLSALPEVDLAGRIRRGPVEIEGDRDSLFAADPATIEKLIYLDVTQGNLADLTGSDVGGPPRAFAHRRVFEGHHWKIGDEVKVVFPRGEQGLVIAGVYGQEFQGADLFVPLTTFDTGFFERVDAAIFLTLREGVTPARGRAAIEAVTKDFPSVQVMDQIDLRNQQSQNINRLLALVNALLGLALVIALFGIVNTLILSVIERIREIGLMRAVGVTRRQIRAMVRWESVIVSVMGASLGIAVGIFLGWLFVRALRDDGLTVFALPGGRLAVFVAIAAFAGVIAAILPARRAARIDVLQAIAYE